MPMTSDLDFAAPPLTRSHWISVAKYFRIFRTALNERLVHRGDFFLGSVLRFMPMLTTILLWHAVYAGAKQDRLAGFNLHEMVAYLLLVHISRMFSSMPTLAAGIGRDIRDGSLKKFLVQPLDLLGYLLSYRIAHKAAYIVTASVPYATLILLCRGYFDSFPDSTTLGAYVVSLLLSFLIGFFMEASLGLLGFWFLEVSAFLYVVNTLNYFVSGQMFPLDLLPGPMALVLKLLPFQYLAYVPAAVFLGKIHGEQLVLGLLGEVAWAIGFFLVARLLFRLGLRRYSAFGG